MDDLESVCDDADSEELLAVVAAVHHHTIGSRSSRGPPRTVSAPSYEEVEPSDTPVDQTLNDGHLRLLELLLGITAGGVGEVDGVADLDVVGEGDVLNLDTKDTNKYASRGYPSQSICMVPRPDDV